VRSCGKMPARSCGKTMNVHQDYFFQFFFNLLKYVFLNNWCIYIYISDELQRTKNITSSVRK
jgi:hypothetical protein